MPSSQHRAIPIARILRFHWRAAWRYPGLVVGCLLAAPLTVLVDTILPPLIVSDVLNRISAGDYQRNQLWTSFSANLIAYAAVVFLGWIVTWRIVDYFLWRLEGRVQRDLAQRCFGHLIGQSADFHANTFGGALVSQTSKLMGSYIRIADTTVFQLLRLVCVLGSIVAIMAAKAALFAVILALAAAVPRAHAADGLVRRADQRDFDRGVRGGHRRCGVRGRRGRHDVPDRELHDLGGAAAVRVQQLGPAHLQPGVR